MLVVMLKQDGHQAKGVTSASEALRVCLSERFDCMVLDAQLGMTAGLAVAERLADSPMRPTHIVIVTGHPKDDFQAAAPRVGRWVRPEAVRRCRAIRTRQAGPKPDRSPQRSRLSQRIRLVVLKLSALTGR